MKTRRNFIKSASLGIAGAALVGCSEGVLDDVAKSKILGDQRPAAKFPIIVSTWNHGHPANAAGIEMLNNGGSILDAVEAGVRDSESDPENQSVGLGGLPDRDGNVTLDACIMDHESRCGAVAFLQNIENPISVARKVMEDTPHVMLSGAGAL